MCEVRPEEKPYFPFRDELAVEGDLIYKGQRLVVPAALRDEIKQKLHASDMGMESTLQRARDCVFWPQMNAEVKDYITACEICQAHSYRQQKKTPETSPSNKPAMGESRSGSHGVSRKKLSRDYGLLQWILGSRPVTINNLSHSHQETESTLCKVWHSVNTCQ